MAFQISGLGFGQFAPLVALSDEQLLGRNARRVVADRHPGFPCRVSLVDAQPGERVLLVNYEHLAVDSPYRARHAIYVRENAVEARLAVDEIPPVFNKRLLSLRAYDAAGMLRDAEVAEGVQLKTAIERLLAPPEIAYLHVHNARPGCYAGRVDRA
jgi:Protein of unknown function (DUF1203)